MNHNLTLQGWLITKTSRLITKTSHPLVWDQKICVHISGQGFCKVVHITLLDKIVTGLSF